MSDTRKKMKFNILDVVVILVITVLVVAYCFRSNIFANTLSVSEPSKMEVSVKVEGVRIYTVDAFSVGDSIYDRETGNLLGEISEVRYEPSYETVKLDGTQTEDGTAKAVLLESPGRYDVYITFDATGKINDEGSYINGNKLVAPNSSLSISTQKVITEGKIISVNEVVAIPDGGEKK